jgi:hypothetical protein
MKHRGVADIKFAQITKKFMMMVIGTPQSSVLPTEIA